MKNLLITLAIWLLSTQLAAANTITHPGVNPQLSFVYQGNAFSPTIKQQIENVVRIAERDVRLFFPNMTKKINFTVSTLDRDLSMVGGATGMTMRHIGTAQIHLQLSTYNGSTIDAAIQDGLRSLVLHEVHHVARGWAIEDNRFPYGIDIAAVNEGLAVVFTELLTGVSYAANQAPADVDKWVAEIMALPHNANYMHWVSGEHPDGRTAIGYKAGRHIIYQALLEGDKNIIQLSKLSIDDILAEAGIKRPVKH